MKSTAKAIGIVTIIMISSRLLALVSSSLYVSNFQGTVRFDIYAYAINLPNIIFNSLGTALVTVIIPIFAGYLSTGEKKRAFKFADNIISFSLVFTGTLTILCVAATPVILYLVPDFREQDYNFSVFALRVMFPIMIFYAMNYIFQGILQSFGRFNMPAFVSIPSSIIVIIYIVLFGQTYGVKGLLIATFIGLTTQALILIPPVFKTEYRYRPSLSLGNEDVIKALKLVPPVLVGTGAYQINMLFNSSFASSFENTIGIMNWVQNLILYAVLAFVFSVTAVIFPRFTALFANKDMEGFKETIIKSLRTVLYILIPCTAGFIAVRYQLVGLLIKYKQIGAREEMMASTMIALYALGVAGVGIKEIVDRAFYSQKDTVRPTINGVIMMLVNIAASFTLAQFMGVYGIPLGYSIASLTGAFVLLYLLRKKIGAIGLKKLALYVVKVATASLIMFLAVTVINKVFENYTFGFAFMDRCVKLFVPAALGAALYFIITYLFRIDESVDVLNKARSLVFRKKV
jgi:putative peptidoglycan lipid II flippase